MESKWLYLKPEAVRMRRNGASLKDVEGKLGIPRSTLSGWFKNVELTEQQRKKLHQNWLNALVKARSMAVPWHKKQKEMRINDAKQKAEILLNEININDQILVLATSMLYLGEGFKNSRTGLANSNPLIVKFFLKILRNVYKVDIKKIQCSLHLRADQNENEMKKYWANELQLPLENFKQSSFDKRTKGKISYDSYKGVCVICCSPVAIQRELVYLSEKFCERILMGG